MNPGTIEYSSKRANTSTMPTGTTNTTCADTIKYNERANNSTNDESNGEHTNTSHADANNSTNDESNGEHANTSHTDAIKYHNEMNRPTPALALILTPSSTTTNRPTPA